RFFLLKESTLFWFTPLLPIDDEGDVIEDSAAPVKMWYPSGGLNLSTETQIEMASTKKTKFFTSEFKPKLSLEVESRVLRYSLKVNFDSDKTRQKWTTKMKQSVRKRVEYHQTKRLSLTRGVLDHHGFEFNDDDKIDPLDDPDFDSETEDIKSEEEDATEDIEQGLGAEIRDIV